MGTTRSQVNMPLTFAAEADAATQEIITANYAFARLKMGPAFTGTNILIEAKSYETDDFETATDTSGTALSVAFVADQKIPIPDAAMGYYSIRLVSDGTEAAIRTMHITLNA